MFAASQIQLYKMSACPHSQSQCRWRAGGDCIAFWHTSGRRDLLYFILNHGAAKNKPQMNADERKCKGATCDVCVFDEGGGITSIPLHSPSTWNIPLKCVSNVIIFSIFICCITVMVVASVKLIRSLKNLKNMVFA